MTHFIDDRISTFQAADGRYYRELELHQRDQAAAGIVCRAGESWRWVIVHESEPAANPEGYVTVGAYSAIEIGEVFEKLGGETPLSSEEEGRLIANNWQTTPR